MRTWASVCSTKQLLASRPSVQFGHTNRPLQYFEYAAGSSNIESLLLADECVVYSLNCSRQPHSSNHCAVMVLLMCDWVK
jgi:hypothetical protein